MHVHPSRRTLAPIVRALILPVALATALAAGCTAATPTAAPPPSEGSDWVVNADPRLDGKWFVTITESSGRTRHRAWWLDIARDRGTFVEQDRGVYRNQCRESALHVYRSRSDPELFGIRIDRGATVQGCTTDVMIVRFDGPDTLQGRNARGTRTFRAVR